MGFFGQKKDVVPPHPRAEARVDLPISGENIAAVFAGNVDFAQRSVAVGGDERKTVTLYYISGMVKMERASDYLLRPLAQDKNLAAARDAADLMARIEAGALYNLDAQRRETMDELVFDMIGGACVMLFHGAAGALTFGVGTEEKRGITAPDNEPPVKGPRDAFVESLRTNTSLVRRRVRTPDLKVREQLVGRQTVTAVDLLWVEGITNPETVALVQEQLAKIDIAGLISAGDLEENLVGTLHTAFPLLAYTQRPDRFSEGLIEGRVGLIADGLPLGFLLPATLGFFMRTPQDRSNNWVLALALTVLRYLALLVTLLLPALYIAFVTFHPELLPMKLTMSIIAAKQDVPFSTIFEVLLLLMAFELLQEAGLRLPTAIGQTVSILGGLVVGQAAVEARIVSPAVLIVVAAAGIAGYVMPSQDLAGALRIWRFALAVLASFGGIFGTILGAAGMVIHLAGLESFGVAYLTPFAANAGAQVEGETVLREPLPQVKLREAALKTKNRRQQK